MPKHKTETLIIVFYVMYSAWLFTVTYLTTDPKLLNFFMVGIIFFYFLFLREKFDLVFFLAACLVPVTLAAHKLANWQPGFLFDEASMTPLWLPLAWGTTVLALRKFYLLVSRKTFF